jgi:hypothetical protein
MLLETLCVDCCVGDVSRNRLVTGICNAAGDTHLAEGVEPFGPVPGARPCLDVASERRARVSLLVAVQSVRVVDVGVRAARYA